MKKLGFSTNWKELANHGGQCALIHSKTARIPVPICQNIPEFNGVWATGLKE